MADSGIEAVKKHFPAGSIIVDAAMIGALLFSWGQLTQTLRDVDSRVARLEAAQTQPSQAIEEHFRAIENTIARQDRESDESKADVVSRLARIEAKLDRIK